jgi:hypothetical protein
MSCTKVFARLLWILACTIGTQTIGTFIDIGRTTAYFIIMPFACTLIKKLWCELVGSWHRVTCNHTDCLNLPTQPPMHQHMSNNRWPLTSAGPILASNKVLVCAV